MKETNHPLVILFTWVQRVWSYTMGGVISILTLSPQLSSPSVYASKTAHNYDYKTLFEQARKSVCMEEKDI